MLTSTCASLRSDIAHLESQLSRVQQELSSTLATTDTHAHRSTELEGTIANLKQQLSGVQELQRMYAEEKERATKYSSKVKELRVELLKVASDADKTIGEERGARQVAEREASEARKQLGLAMSKYKEKDEKVHEVCVGDHVEIMIDSVVDIVELTNAVTAGVAKVNSSVKISGSCVACCQLFQGQNH